MRRTNNEIMECQTEEGERKHGQILEQVSQKGNMQKQPIVLVEICSTSLSLREMQVEDTIRYHPND